ncbi:MAG TPA: exopolysaccharide biosynthesis polyprenyl glycosylphosphotransferase [Verrucomicrobiae bacterium]|nr:exopolysaccharide biosynthesis polyprenyl glycosylphosphotransferase [Verrucomicrobiae bacterium]
MISQRSIGIRSLAMMWQIVLVTLSYWGWMVIWQSALLSQREVLQRYLLFNEFLLIGLLFGSAHRRDATTPEHTWVVAARRSARQAFIGLFCVFLVVFVLQDTPTDNVRSFMFSYVPWLYLTLLFSNYLLPRLLSRWAFSGDREERVALAGTVEQAALIKPWLERKSLVGFRTVGLVCPCGDVPGPPPFPLLGSLENLGQILRERSITQVIVLDLSMGSPWVRQLTQLCESAAVRLLAIHDPSDYFNHSVTTFEDDGMRFIGLREEPLESPLNRFIKRFLDITISLPVVVLVLPVSTVLVWAAQRVQSPGPVFFKQCRTGMMGRPFTMLKYRTMRTDHRCEEKQATREDPRVFGAGKWLRKLSIDELPQFINVLRGEMSVVGPRPHLPQHDERFTDAMKRYPIRKLIRPGITGWAQVNGYRGEIHSDRDIEQRVEADIYYLEHWSFSLDCLILLKTFRQCIAPPRSAY